MSSTRDELYSYAFASNICKRWHWFGYHFKMCSHGIFHPFAESIIQACLDCERYIPGFSVRMLDTLASISGKERNEEHYEQLMQRLAEIHVIRRVIQFEWPAEVTFAWEPRSSRSKKNPELIICCLDYKFGIEVKAPSILKHARQREQNPHQVPARNLFSMDLIQTMEPEGLTKPRDNPVKDFLLSADSKFEPFKQEIPNFNSILVIVWDDFIYEPISSLLHPASGLFTPNSFAKDSNNNCLKFLNIDGIVIVRHLHQLMNAAGDKPLGFSCKEAFDYGQDGEFPYKAFIPNPHGKPTAEIMLKCLQARPPSLELGDEYLPQDWVLRFRLK